MQTTKLIISEDEPPLRGRAARQIRTPGPAKRSPRRSPAAPIGLMPNDWRWQMQNRIRDVQALAVALGEKQLRPGIQEASSFFPMAITPYYAGLIHRADASDPIFAMAVAQGEELIDPPFLRADPLEEERDMPVPGLVHRYPDRALLISTSTCAMYCRHCTRKRVIGHRENSVPKDRVHAWVDYLLRHPEIRDVIVSGGDPLTLPTRKLDAILSAVRSVPSVDIIRVGSRVPVTMPMRIDKGLVAMLRRHQPLWLNTQFNHPRELTPEAISACARIVDAGIPLSNQSVLLRGVNDDPVVMEELCRGLVRNRIRPYYLFQCDLVRGVEHFRTPLARGIEIMEYLRGRLSGLAIPTFVVDAPHGGGKIPVLPTYVISTSPTHTVLRNFEGLLVSYPEPNAGSHSTTGRISAVGPTVSDLSRGLHSHLGPESSARQIRRRS